MKKHFYENVITRFGGMYYQSIVLSMMYLILFVCLIDPVKAYAGGDSTSIKNNDSVQKNWTLGIPVWIPGYRGQFAVGGVEVGGEPEGEGILNRLFSEEFSLDFYFVGKVDYKWQRWNFHGDIFAGTIGKSVNFTLTDKTVVDASLQVLMPRVIAGYEILNPGPEIFPINNWQFYAGIRYYSLDIDYELPGITERQSATNSWADALFGTQISIHILKRLQLNLSGDIGGFARDHEPTLFGNFFLDYRICSWFSANFGWVGIYINRQREAGSTELSYDIDLSGPVLGIGFNF